MASKAAQLAADSGLAQPRILLAPVGAGYDIPFIEPVSRDLTGIDVSPEAVASISQAYVSKHVGDMRHMTQFRDGSFDMVITSLFYHHFLKFGFDDFLRETLRVLRPGGDLLVREPSSLHPLHWATWLARRIFGNITGTVADEAPLRPRRMASAMSGVAASPESASRPPASVIIAFPSRLARLNNLATRPLLNVPGIRALPGCVFSADESRANPTSRIRP